jgi:hypothetical protein
LDGRDVSFERVQAVLGGHHLMAVGLKRGDQFAKHEPSAQSPCAKTMLGLVCLEFILKILLEHGLWGERKQRLMQPARAVLSDLA